MSDEDIPSQDDSVSKHVEILKIQETFESVEGSCVVSQSMAETVEMHPKRKAGY